MNRPVLVLHGQRAAATILSFLIVGALTLPGPEAYGASAHRPKNNARQTTDTNSRSVPAGDASSSSSNGSQTNTRQEPGSTTNTNSEYGRLPQTADDEADGYARMPEGPARIVENDADLDPYGQIPPARDDAASQDGYARMPEGPARIVENDTDLDPYGQIPPARDDATLRSDGRVVDTTTVDMDVERGDDVYRPLPAGDAGTERNPYDTVESAQRSRDYDTADSALRPGQYDTLRLQPNPYELPDSAFPRAGDSSREGHYAQLQLRSPTENGADLLPNRVAHQSPAALGSVLAGADGALQPPQAPGSAERPSTERLSIFARIQRAYQNWKARRGA